MNQKDRRDAGLLYDCKATGDPSWLKCRQTLPAVNACTDQNQIRKMLEELLGSYPESSGIITPFYCDLGSRLFLGERTFINMDCLFLDEGTITLKDRVLVGPRCSFYTPVHPMDPAVRATGLELAKKIVVEEDVWIAGGCTINPGVTIGKGSVIGSGSAVVGDIPAGVFAAGNPCRVIRKLDVEDRKYWKEQLDEYLGFLKEN